MLLSMRQIDISKKLNVSAMFISNLLNGKRFTTNKDLAIALSGYSGKPAIDFISPAIREAYLKAWPELADVLSG